MRIGWQTLRRRAAVAVPCGGARPRPTQHHRVGCIGHYAATDDETAHVLLDHACSELRRRGCTLAVGPLDGSTWCNYRFVTDFGDRPRFWMEPDNPPQWPQQYLRNGFRVLAEYFSALNSQLDCRDDRLDGVAQRLASAGVTMRPVCEETFEADLRRIFQVARTAFRHHLLYSELDESHYLAQITAAARTGAASAQLVGRTWRSDGRVCVCRSRSVRAGPADSGRLR